MPRHNEIFEVIVNVADNSNALTIPSTRDLIKAMEVHPEWIHIKRDVELQSLLLKVEDTRRNYTSVYQLRKAYQRVVDRFIEITLDERCDTLTYHLNEREMLSVSKVVALDGDDRLRNVYELRTITETDASSNPEFHGAINTGFFNALAWRMRSRPTHRASPFGYPSAQAITEYVEANNTRYN